MKKITALFFVLALSVTNVFSYTFMLQGGYFDDDSDLNTPITSAQIAIIVDSQKGDFSDFKLELGDVISGGASIDERYSTFFLTELNSDGVIDFIQGNIVNEDYGVAESSTFAVLCFVPESDSFTGTIEEGTKYVVFNPNMVTESGVDKLSGGAFDWVVPADGSGEYLYALLTVDNIPPEYATLSNIVIPEPSTWAILCGVIALAFAIRRKK